MNIYQYYFQLSCFNNTHSDIKDMSFMIILNYNQGNSSSVNFMDGNLDNNLYNYYYNNTDQMTLAFINNVIVEERRNINFIIRMSTSFIIVPLYINSIFLKIKYLL